MSGGTIRVRCALEAGALRILERRLNWWTERLVASDEPIRWHLTARIADIEYNGVEATGAAIEAARRLPRAVHVHWDLVVDSADGEQIAAVLHGTLRRRRLRRAALTVQASDVVFGHRLAAELTHSRWQSHQLPLPLEPIRSVDDLLATR